MAVSPGYRPPNMEVQEKNRLYGETMRDFSLFELFEALSQAEVCQIEAAANSGKDVLRADISDLARSCRYNAEVYDDQTEDLIAESAALMALIQASRSDAGHESAERVRLLRSARATAALAVRALSKLIM